MQVTRVTVRIPDVNYNEGDYRNNLRANISVELDKALVVHGCKLIEGEGGLFLAMPSEVKTDRCPECYVKTPITANYCHRCGLELERGRKHTLSPDKRGKIKVAMDVAHPVTTELRDHLLQACLEEYYWATNEKDLAS